MGNWARVFQRGMDDGLDTVGNTGARGSSVAEPLARPWSNWGKKSTTRANDAAATDEDTPAVIDVLANDTDIDGDTLNVVSVADPANGTAVDNGDGTVTYTPDPDFNGTDWFVYTAGDGNGGTDIATVTVTVNPVNDAPVANDDTAETNEDTAATVDVLDNDGDTEGDDKKDSGKKTGDERTDRAPQTLGSRTGNDGNEQKNKK